MIKKLYLIFYDFGKQLQRDNISAYASSIAFFFFLSIVPLLIIASLLITYTPITEQNLVDFILRYIPAAIDDVIVGFVSQIYNMSRGILPIAIVVAIWSAGKGMMGLQMGLNVVHGVVESRNFFVIRLQACIYTIITMFAIFLTFGVSIFSRSLLRTIRVEAPHISPIIQLVVDYRFVVSWVIYAVFFTMLYTFLPNEKVKLRYQIPGAVFSAIAWVIFSWAFSKYIELSNGMSTYGSMSTIIIVMIWLYVAMYILLIGANLNKYFRPVIKVFLKRK